MENGKKKKPPTLDESVGGNHPGEIAIPLLYYHLREENAKGLGPTPERRFFDMQRVKRRTFSGVVCEQEVYNVPDRIKSHRKGGAPARASKMRRSGAPQDRHFAAENARLINENYGPTSLYSTLTLDNESEVHTFDEARRIRDLYVRRLKYHVPDAKINIYMGRGKTTFRIHFHMISGGRSRKADPRSLGPRRRIEDRTPSEHNYYNG